MILHNLTSTAALYAGDNRDALRKLPDNCLDSCVTDPPYALVSVVKRFGAANAAPAKDYTGEREGATGAYMRASAGFMGKTWDTGETAMSAEFWAEVYRVLKPGAFLAAFGATRGYHRMACAIEDAGFEIRDSLAWLYGTGFPKSHDVSKGIDDHLFGVWLDESGHRATYAEHMRIATTNEAKRKVGADWREYGGFVREVICQRTDGRYANPMPVSGRSAGIMGEVVERQAPFVSAPATPDAAEWEGWGTALKPAFEPIVLARKPLSEGTVAANVLRWGTGAINIDACRIGTDETIKATRNVALGSSDGGIYGAANTPGVYVQKDGGRWPANVVHDGSAEVVEAFPITHSAGAAREEPGGGSFESDKGWGGIGKGRKGSRIGDAGGSAARFFYSAKASKADRAGSKHPTVKPINLIRWLSKLITPPGGVVLDPFAGSGTTAVAALAEGFRVILCEREAEYVADIRDRFAAPSIVPAITPPPY